MRLYLVDDDISVIKMLQEIINDGHLGDIVGYQTDSLKAYDEIMLYKPDLLIVDMLMPQMDGATLTKRCQVSLPHSKAIMISQVSSKQMIGDAYENGVNFFITKPVNKKEVTQVIKNITEQIKLETSMSQIKSLLQGQPVSPHQTLVAMDSDFEKKAKVIFARLGILGESGCDELIKLCNYVKENHQQAKLKDISCVISDNPKATEQRIRRTINKGMTNLACLGIEDYLNDSFVKYSNTLFDFEQVRMEMEYRRGRKSYGGKINIMKFVDNLLLLVDEVV